jgi:hypothetical protein
MGNSLGELRRNILVRIWKGERRGVSPPVGALAAY